MGEHDVDQRAPQDAPSALAAFAALSRAGRGEATLDQLIDPTPDNALVRRFVAERYGGALETLQRAWGEPTWEGAVRPRDRYTGPPPWSGLYAGYWDAIRAAWWRRDGGWSVLLVSAHDAGSLVFLSAAVSPVRG